MQPPRPCRARTMHSLCPHCRNAIDPVRVTVQVIACPSCGSGFRLGPRSTATCAGATRR